MTKCPFGLMLRQLSLKDPHLQRVNSGLFAKPSSPEAKSPISQPESDQLAPLL